MKNSLDENMILIDKDGQHILKNGIKDKSFFIYPYQQVYLQHWSNDLKKDHRSTIQVDRFDTRNQCKYFIRLKQKISLFD